MRYFRAIMVALIFGAMTVPSQAFLFLLALGAGQQKPVPPPKLLELPPLNLDKPIRLSDLPAPLLTTPQNRPMPRLEQQLAQNNADELRELRRRLDQLEEENRRLRGQASQPAPSAPLRGLPSTRLPEQVTSGWWVHIHEWNKDGDLGTGPIRTFRYDQQEFKATIGFQPEKRYNWTELRIFRLEAWLRVTTPGSYQIGSVLNCAWEHLCNYSIALDGIRIAQFNGRHEGAANHLVFGTRHLEPGDYRMEMTYHITKQNFILYRPDQVVVQPQIRTSGDMNFRYFRSDELLIPDRRDVPIGPPIL